MALSDNTRTAEGDRWKLFNGDCVEVMRQLPSDSIHHSIFSPPYLSLYTYSASPRDLGNSATDDEFWVHFGFVIDELLRLTKPGRIVAVDCMNVPAMKERDGYIGLKDFRGDLIRQFTKRSFIFHSEHCMWKDPLIEATRTKALGLMHKQLCKDSAMSRAGLPQYLLAFRKPGVNPEPVAHENGLEDFFGERPPESGNLSHERWRRYASPVWGDIDFTETLNAKAAREHDDERHVCPIALDIVRRSLTLWSNPGDVVFSPFTGIGSEGFVSLKMGRRFLGAELKESYFRQAAGNLEEASSETSRQSSLFVDQAEGSR
ncbi:MAG TPA: DNA methyltransferase [Polyangiales bacterium]|nr:DNA methyltransferase [Polyangiales bacterium]